MVYIVNYYGLFSEEQLISLKNKYGNIVVDNAQAFFTEPVKGIDTIYSCRKFFGVPDGGYAYTEKLVKASEFEKFIEDGTTLCNDIGYKLWGVNLNKDSLNYKHCLPFNTKAIILGPFCCHIEGTEIRYDEDLPLKEDYDLAIQHLNKYRGILRLNKYHYNCKQSTNAGGCATYRNYDREREQFELLKKKWGSNIVKEDKSKQAKSKKAKMNIDYNPIIKIPIKGV